MTDVERQRRCQERRRRGAVVVQRIVLSPTALDGLINLGWLYPADRGSKRAVDSALMSRRHMLVGPQR